MEDLDVRITRIAATQHGVFSSGQVSDLTRDTVWNRVDRRRWCRHGPGVYTIVGAPDTWEQRLWIALLRAGDGSVIGRRSAAVILRLTTRFDEAIDIVQPEPTTPRAKPGTSRRTSRLPSWHVIERRGFPVTTVERTLFDLAGLTSPRRRRRGWAYLPAPMVERMLDDALVRKRTTIAALTRTFLSLAGRGRPGTALMRELLEVRSETYVPTESELEDLFVAFVERHALPTPRRQVPLGSDDALIGRVDFLFEHARLVVEVDGRAFHAQRMVQRRDRRRDLELLNAGWRVLRLTWHDLTVDGDDIAERLRGIVTAVPR